MATSTASISFHPHTRERAHEYAKRAGVTLSALVDYALRVQLEQQIPSELQQAEGVANRKQCKTCFRFGHNSRRCESAERPAENIVRPKPVTKRARRSPAPIVEALAEQAAKYMSENAGTVAAVSTAFGVSRRAVTVAWKKLFGETPVPTMRARDGRIGRAVARVDSGESVKAAAAAEGCAPSNVYTAILKRKQSAEAPTDSASQL